MNHKVTVWAVTAALVATITGCSCCQATDSSTSQTPPQASAPAPAKPTLDHPKKAVTPDGEVFWIVAEWDACCTPCKGKHGKSCRSAKCWKTRGGKIMCVKPLRKCPKNGKGCTASEHYRCKSQNNCVMCPQESAAQGQDSSCNYAAKEVKPCPANGGSACKAGEHVNLPNGKKACAPADKKNPQANAPIEMDDSFESDEVFEITSVN